jgi:hypothetical protein
MTMKENNLELAAENLRENSQKQAYTPPKLHRNLLGNNTSTKDFLYTSEHLATPPTANGQPQRTANGAVVHRHWGPQS